jgi:hypothetical protein
MPYRHVPFDHMSEPTHDVFRRANVFLADVYSMLKITPSPASHAGGCNFSAALVLLCVVDALARDVYPTEAQVHDHEQRFKQLIRERLPWGPSNRRWIDRGHAAKWFYVEFRNGLVHELGKDKSVGRRPPKQYEPVIGRWGNVPRMRVDSLDALTEWNVDWPVLTWKPYQDGKRVSLSTAALYWAVKRMVGEMARDFA